MLFYTGFLLVLLKDKLKINMKAAERNRALIIDYISDPDNPFPSRSEMALVICNYKEIASLYKTLTKEQLTEIEAEGLAARRRRYTSLLSDIDKSMISEAKSGNCAAAKLIYERIEGAVDQGVNVHHSGNILEDGIQISFVKAEKKEKK